METIYKAYKYRLYPTKEQQVLINRHIGACRWIYNHCLEKKICSYQQTGISLSRFDLQKELPLLKQQEETRWLKEINSQSLQVTLEHMNTAFVRFFREKKGFPKFKAKHFSRQSFSIPQNIRVNWETQRVSVPKLKNIRFALDRKPEGTIKSATISKTPTNKFFISILVDTGVKSPGKPKINKKTSIGIDLGIKHFIVLSDGTKVENPKHLKKNLFRLKKLQRRASHKQKGSKNRKKANLKVAKLHERIRNLRTDFLHKLSSKLIRENQTICLEDLSVANMMKNHKLAQSIQDCAWGTFTSMLIYKAEWNGKNILTIGRFDPSSKMCSVCGHINRELTLDIREWECSECHEKHDRDINAARNIKQFALLKQNVGAERPKLKLLENTLSERGSVKEETVGPFRLR